MNLSEVIDELVEERGLDRDVLSSIVREGMLAAYQRKYPQLPFKAEYDQDTGEVVILIQKKIVSTVTDEDSEISLKKVRYIDKKLDLSDMVWLPFTGKIGRIEILRARQVIASQIYQVEAEIVYNEFKDRAGDIIHGVIHKCERSGTVVKLDETLAFLPKSLTSPNDKCVIGFPIRALLKEVLLEPRNDNQLILDRTSEDFLQKLLELEIPEIYEKLVEIKKIVRVPGYKSKVIVFSHDQNIDPVGTCVGVGGSRIKPILKELGSEKIDVISFSETLEDLVKDALKPALVDRVELVNSKTAKVWVDEDQRALAIGKMGQNISLASRLVGIDIQLVQEAEKKVQSEAEIFEEE